MHKGLRLVYLNNYLDIVYRLKISKRYHTNENIACSFFVVTNFEIWVYKGMIIQFLLVT